MRIIQLIDSVEAGGAERMAVSYANALSSEIEFSGLIATRKEGVLKEQLHQKVNYLFLNKRNNFDIKAFQKFRKYIIKNKVQIIHAHSSSFFWATLIKLSYPKIKIIWHDHYGNSEFLKHRKFAALKICSFFFSSIIVVNSKLLEWGSKKLNCKKIFNVSNFTTKNENEISLTKLHGIDNKRIIILANLRPQKNHFLALKIAKIITKKYVDWSFHFVGKDFEDSYSEEIKKIIEIENLQKSVYLYGSREDISTILNQSTIALLTSSSEGLPVCILEYGLHKLPVITSNVGEISSVITSGENGFLCDNKEVDIFIKNIEKLILDVKLRHIMGKNNYEIIKKRFSKEAIINDFLSIYRDTVQSN